MEPGAWDRLYAQVGGGNPLRGSCVVLAYNSVLDLVRSVDEAFLATLPPVEGDPPTYAREPQDLGDVARALAHSMARGSAMELLCTSGVLGELQTLGPYEMRPGGQVVNIARLLSNFGAQRIIVHPDRFDPRVASLYEGTNAVVPRPGRGGLEFLPASDFYWDCEPEVHVILEYPRGLRYNGGPPAPRANRIILAPSSRVEFHPAFDEALAQVAPACDRAILAGLNHMGVEYRESFEVVLRHIGTLRNANPTMRIHLEFTSMQMEEKRGAILRDILPLVDSVGMNEVELSEAVQVLGWTDHRDVRTDVVAQLRAIRALQNLGVARVHLHTLGHYLCATPNPVEGCRSALVFAAIVAAARAIKGEVPEPTDVQATATVPLAAMGLDRITALAEYLREKGLAAEDFPRTGIEEDEGLVMVPTKVVERPRATVGMGDVISGAAFVAEPWKT